MPEPSCVPRRFARLLPLALPASCLAVLAAATSLFAQAHQPAAAAPEAPGRKELPAVARGRAAFAANCGFCHGNNATGARAPDLLRSATVSHDVGGNLIGQIVHNGRVAQGMPAFPALKDDTVNDITAFLHNQADRAANSAEVPGDYPLAKMLTGNAQAGKAYFEGAGGCTGCHSVTGNLAGIAKKYSPVDLQQHMVYPFERKTPTKTAVITTADGTRYQGDVSHLDEFTIALKTSDGWERTWPRDTVKAEITDRLAAHRELTTRYTDADIHNLFAYLESLH